MNACGPLVLPFISVLEQHTLNDTRKQDMRPISPVLAILQRYSSIGLYAVSHEELFAFQTPLTLASGTPQAHLLTANNATLQMALGKIRECVDKGRAAVKTLRSPDSAFGTRLIGFMYDFLIDFEQSLDVVGCERNGNQHDVFLTLLDE